MLVTSPGFPGTYRQTIIMNALPSMPSPETISDADLVSASLNGDRDAFGRIVVRYQRLLCSLAYSATGSVYASEDVAQEAFVEAWKQLRSLREPEKLRPWLCGILRNRVGRLRRRDEREPTHKAGCLDWIPDMSATEPATTQIAMQKEEQAILWAELERVPGLYREPLILYYREHRSIEHVAAALDLSEDAVKQRLARGRKILQERVLAFVESTLERSNPTKVFTVGVLAALPALLPTPAEAAATSTIAVQSGALAKTTGAVAWLSSTIGLANLVLAIRCTLDQSRTPRERRAVIKGISCSFGSALAVLGAIYSLRAAAFQWWDARTIFSIACFALVVGFAIALPIGSVRMMRYFRRLRSEQRRIHPECFLAPRDQLGATAGEYRSRFTLFGVPLLHVRFCLADEGAPPLFGWIALGDRAYGLLFAWGTVAVAPISAGVFSVGLFSAGAVSVGLISLGTAAIGIVAVGCMAIGLQASAWLAALGLETAQSNGFATAFHAARAPVAFAEHANTPAAHQVFAPPYTEQIQMNFFLLIAALSLVPLVCYVTGVRKRLGRETPGK